MDSAFIVSGKRMDALSGMTIADAFRTLGMNPSAYVFVIGGRPVPMDSDVPDGVEITALKVASGGRSRERPCPAGNKDPAGRHVVPASWCL